MDIITKKKRTKRKIKQRKTKREKILWKIINIPNNNSNNNRILCICL